MKKILIALVIILGCWSVDIDAQSTEGLNSTPTIGVMDVFDTELKLNHNQAFKKFLTENKIKSAGKVATIDLIEHQNNSRVAVNAIFGNNQLITTIYNEGKIFIKDTSSVLAIEKTKFSWSIALGLVESPAGITIVYVPQTYLTNNKELKAGQVVLKIDGISVGHDLAIAKKLLISERDRLIALRTLDPASGKEQSFSLPTLKSQIKYWEYPLSSKDLSSIFEVFYRRIANYQKELGLQLSSSVKNSTIELLRPRNETGKCFAQEQLATCMSETHPVSLYSQQTSTVASPNEKINTVFKQEVFDYPKKKEKNSTIGDASLWVMKYYNFDQNESHLIRHSSIDENLKESVKRLSGPYYNKPGVWANYFAAATEYEMAKNYRAALNQYYASLRKIDDIICSELTKVRAKKIAIERIADCSNKLGQKNYAALLVLADDCLKESIINNDDLNKGDQNFYSFAGDIQKTCIEIESKLKEQRSEKAWAIAGAITNAAAGIATINFDSYLSTSFLFNAVDIIDQNAEFNAKTNMMLADATKSIDIKLPAELEDEERSPYEILATSYINYALAQSSNPEPVLNKILVYADGKPALKNAVEKTKASWQQSGKLDHSNLVNELLRLETIFYRYEKRGLKVPDIVVP